MYFKSIIDNLQITRINVLCPTTDMEQYTLSKIEYLFAEMSDGAAITKLHLRDVYCQLELDEGSRYLVMISTHGGLLRYSGLVFGMASASAISQKEMEKILQSIKQVTKYLDNTF